jgi:regulator of protease activity HflC (stomatin/prohibitin superfamily)
MAARALFGVFLLALLIWGFSGVYQVDQGETAVEVVLGRVDFEPTYSFRFNEAVDKELELRLPREVRDKLRPLAGRLWSEAEIEARLAEVFTKAESAAFGDTVLREMAFLPEDELIQPGLHITWPWPIAQVYKIPRSQTRTLTLNQFLVSNDMSERAKSRIREKFKNASSDVLDAVFDPTVTTGDRNTAHLGMTLRYVVGPPRYLPKAVRRRDGGDRLRTAGWNWQMLLPENESSRDFILESVAYSVITECAARLPVTDVLSTGRSRIEDYVRFRVQERLDAMDVGVTVIRAEIKDARVPKFVREDFENVVKAEAQAAKEVHDAETRSSELIAEGQGSAAERLKLAEADRDRIVKQARTDAEAFRKLAAEYRLNPETTLTQLWNGMFRKIAPNVRVQIVPDSPGDVVIQVQSRKQ